MHLLPFVINPLYLQFKFAHALSLPLLDRVVYFYRRVKHRFRDLALLIVIIDYSALSAFKLCISVIFIIIHDPRAFLIVYESTVIIADSPATTYKPTLAVHLRRAHILIFFKPRRLNKYNALLPVVVFARKLKEIVYFQWFAAAG